MAWGMSQCLTATFKSSSFPSRPVHEHAPHPPKRIVLPSHWTALLQANKAENQLDPGTEPNGSNGQTKTDCNRSNIPNLGPISEDWAHALQNWKACKSACGFKMLQTTWNCLKLIDCFWAQHSNNLPLPNQSYKKKSWHLRSICWVGSLKGWPRHGPANIDQFRFGSSSFLYERSLSVAWFLPLHFGPRCFVGSFHWSY